MTSGVLKCQCGPQRTELHQVSPLEYFWEQFHKPTPTIGLCRGTLHGQMGATGWNNPKISRAIWAPGVKKLRASIFFKAIFSSSSVFYTSGFEMRQHFQGPFGPLVLKFCGPSPNFEGNWPEGQLGLEDANVLCRELNYTRQVLENRFESYPTNPHPGQVLENRFESYPTNPHPQQECMNAFYLEKLVLVMNLMHFKSLK